MQQSIFPIAGGREIMPATAYVAIPDLLSEAVLIEATLRAVDFGQSNQWMRGWGAVLTLSASGLPDIDSLRNTTLELYNRWPEMIDVAAPTSVRSGMSASFVAEDHCGFVLQHIKDRQFYTDYMTNRIFCPAVFFLPNSEKLIGHVLEKTPYSFPDGRMDLNVQLGSYHDLLTREQLIDIIRRLFVPVSQTLRLGNARLGQMIECSAKAAGTVNHPAYGRVPEKTPFLNFQTWDGEPVTVLKAEWTSL